MSSVMGINRKWSPETNEYRTQTALSTTNIPLGRIVIISGQFVKMTSAGEAGAGMVLEVQPVPDQGKWITTFVYGKGVKVEIDEADNTLAPGKPIYSGPSGRGTSDPTGVLLGTVREIRERIVDPDNSGVVLVPRIALIDTVI